MRKLLGLILGTAALVAVAAQACAPTWSSAFAAVREAYGLERCLEGYAGLYTRLAAGKPT